MSAYETDRPRRKTPLIIILFAVIIVALTAAAYYLGPRLEREGPQIKLAPDSDVLGMAPMDVIVTDDGSGLRSLAATLSVGGTQHTLASEQYAQPVKEKKITVQTAKLSGIKEGAAVLRVTARDNSLWKFFSGNETVVEKNITIDVTPPTLALIADDRYVTFGGVGAIVYKPSPDTVSSGVRIGEYFFPGYKGPVKGQPDHFIALFAHPYNTPASAKAMLVATDKAGNNKEMPLVYELRGAKYRKSSIAISDSFIQNTVTPLVTDVAARQGSAKDIFIAVNKLVRKQNEDKITAITRKSTPSVLWEGAFIQLSNSKVEANFADERTYLYNNESIDTAYHLGYDLSVTKRYPVEAANSGTVTFAGDLGIYGNTVILDHGLGLSTLYGHLSSIDVKEGDSIKKAQIIGRTGETGLAAGDHLHYGVYLNGVAVVPVEWWDAKWINDNIQPKLEGRTGEEIAESQQPKVVRKSAHKRRR